MPTAVLVLLIIAAWAVLSFVLGLVVARVLRGPRVSASDVDSSTGSGQSAAVPQRTRDRAPAGR